MDCYAAFDYAASETGAKALGVDPRRLALSGDSAGGHLTVTTCILAARHGLADQILLQVPICPVLDYREPWERYPSFTQNAEGFFLTGQKMRWFASCFTNGDNKITDSWLCSPAAYEHLHTLAMPPAVVMTATHDPLRDQGVLYHERLVSQGSESVHKSYNAFHAWFLAANAVEPETTEDFLQDLCGALRSKLFPLGDGARL